MIQVVANLDNSGKMLRKRGLEPNGRVQQLFTNECAREMDPYIPFQSGPLKNSRIISPDSITYNQPYAKFHYFGKVMVGIHSRSAWAKQGERKVVTDRDLQHHGASKRGPFWDKRMWADKKGKIVNTVANAAGGVAD